MKKESRLLGCLDTKAFTLIELLVVVLIIGILAAVALPQYQKVVEKSRSAQALTLLKSTLSAAQTYHLANGEWPSSFDELSIDIPWTGNTKKYNVEGDVRSNRDWTLQLENQTTYVSLLMLRLSGEYEGAGFVVQLAHTATAYQNILGEIACVENSSLGYAKSDGDFCNKIMKGTYSFHQGTWKYYKLP